MDAFCVIVLSDLYCPLELSFLSIRVAVAFGVIGLKKVQLSPDLASACCSSTRLLRSSEVGSLLNLGLPRSFSCGRFLSRGCS